MGNFEGAPCGFDGMTMGLSEGATVDAGNGATRGTPGSSRVAGRHDDDGGGGGSAYWQGRGVAHFENQTGYTRLK
jgi:hypothetical protein